MKLPLLFWLIVVLFCACSESSDNVSWEEVEQQTTRNKVILFLGDSLTAGYQLKKEDAFPALVGEKLKKPYVTRNAGVSGATSADVLDSLGWSLQQDVRLVFLCIGANDGMRGNIAELAKNIKKIITICQQKNIKVVLAGMMLPPNYGEEYCKRFRQLYFDISKEMSVELMPFLLKDVAGVESLNLSDAIHPNEKGHKIIADNVYQFLVERNLLP